jgi:hypothetical protein
MLFGLPMRPGCVSGARWWLWPMMAHSSLVLRGFGFRIRSEVTDEYDSARFGRS